MASKVICSATFLLVAVITFASMSSALRPLTPTDHTDGTGMSNLLPVQHGLDKKVEEAKDGEHGGASATEKVANLVSREEEEKKTGSHWNKVKKLDDDDDDDSDSDSDHDHDSDSDHDHDHDSDDDSNDNDDDHDHDSDDDSGDDDDGDDDDDHHNAKNGNKKNHPSHRRKGPPRSKQDDEMPKVEIEV